jgi:PadR family transcriptional regulator, regulatory protein PadR
MERITLPLLQVLARFVADPRDDWFGLELVRATGLSSGTVHESLMRLEKAGWVQAHWEDRATSASHRGPRRRLYQLTATGAVEARRLLEERTRGLRSFEAGS